jgi:hypothetical protein
MGRELIAERTKAGLAAARKAGRIGGRKRSMTPAKIEAARTLMQQGTPAKDVAATLWVSVPTLYRWMPAWGDGIPHGCLGSNGCGLLQALLGSLCLCRCGTITPSTDLLLLQ